MTDLTSSLQIILQEAGYSTWLTQLEKQIIICFEDDVLMGFAAPFASADELARDWLSVETSMINRFGQQFRGAQEKVWNICSVFATEAPADDALLRALRAIEENLDRTRKIAASGVSTREDAITALLPILPIQYRPQLENEQYVERLKRHIASFAPQAADMVLEEEVPPEDVARALGATI